MFDFVMEGAATSLAKVIDVYWERKKRARKNLLDKLKASWDQPKGTIVTLWKGTNFEPDVSYVDLPTWFSGGYSPMLMSVTWPELSDEFHKQDPVIFVFWCSGLRYKYRLRYEYWETKLPFEVTSALSD